MNIGEILYYFRKNRNLKQREIFNYITSSMYSKIESNKQEMRISELIYFLQKTEITAEEFFIYMDLNKKQEIFRTLFKKCSKNLDDMYLKNQLLSFDFEWSDSTNKSLQEFSNYVAIHVYFSNYWSDIYDLTMEQINYIYQLLDDKEIFFQYDYALLSNTIFLFSSEQADHLFKKIFPIKEKQLCTNITKSFMTSIINNIITTTLHKGEYSQAQLYVSIAKKQTDKLNDLHYKMIISYLENLTKYMVTGKYFYLEKVYHIIRTLKEISEEELASSIELEVESLTVKEGYLPKIVANTMYINMQ